MISLKLINFENIYIVYAANIWIITVKRDYGGSRYHMHYNITTLSHK